MKINITFDEIAHQLAHIKDDRTTEMRVAFTLNIILASVAVILRFVSRRIVRAKLQADDYTTMAALVRFFPLSPVLFACLPPDMCVSSDSATVCHLQ